MRKSAVIAVSLHPSMMELIDEYTEKQHMTRSEFFRSALRSYLEKLEITEDVALYQQERAKGVIIPFSGPISDLED